jgi:phosphatidylglycerol:prolipoprotein diacylglycerol transferase
MWPTITEVHTASGGTLGVHTYGLFIALAFSAAFVTIHLRAPRVGIHPDRLVTGYVSAAVGGLLGGHLMYALAVDPSALLSMSGFVFYGGFIGGAIGVGLFCAMAGLSAWKIADLALPAVLIGHGVGRLGCFFAGCCHGGVAPIGPDPMGLLPESFTGGQLWLSGVFPYLTNEVHGGVGRLRDLPIYPTQLWEAVSYTSLAAVILWHWPRRRFDGQTAALTLLLEAPFRLVIEAFRADHRGYVVSWAATEETARLLPGMAQAGDQLGGAVIGITTSQAIGLSLMAVGAVLYAVRRGAGRDTPPAAPPAAEGDLLEELT